MMTKEAIRQTMISREASPNEKRQRTPCKAACPDILYTGTR